ncbi:MAG TPA: hypothetical protein VJH03_01480 [Blastocatellia bacterium]|nr:hypothetical protein [Blastocatellia bacterium]
MPRTIFYSWQSDLPNNTNRNFIERALEQAIRQVAENLEIVDAERESELVLDKDTKGVPGIPPIADVIFDKISKAAVFVPDLTFVCTSTNGRSVPNPNVLIEYGWALKALTHSRIVPVMNCAYGEPTVETLPFDMRHLRHPITYRMTEEVGGDQRASIKAALAKKLADAIRLVLESAPVTNEPPDEFMFEETQSTTVPSTFLNPGEALGVIESFEQEVRIPDNEHLFLRLIPTRPTQPISTGKAALDLIRSGQLQPMCAARLDSRADGRNPYGAFTCLCRDRILYATQLFKNCELWGIDAATIDKESQMREVNISFGYSPAISFGYFPAKLLEETFARTLADYLRFAETILNLPLPLRFIAGATQVQGYRITTLRGLGLPNSKQFAGAVVQPDIVYEGTIDSYGTEVAQTLRPFFERVWEECGLERPNTDNPRETLR